MTGVQTCALPIFNQNDQVGIRGQDGFKFWSQPRHGDERHVDHDQIECVRKAALLARLHKEVADIAKMPEIGKRLSNEGLLPQGTSPSEFEKFIAKEIAKWAKVTKAAGITAQ